MDRKQFYDQQNVHFDELNSAFADAENSDANMAAEAIGFGITEGLVKTANPSGLQLTFSAGSLVDKAGKRVKVASSFTQNFVTDSLGNPVAVNAGEERWVSVFGKISRWYCDKRQIAGQDVNSGFRVKQILSAIDVTTEGAYDPENPPAEPTSNFYIVAGTTNGIGYAVRPALHSEYVLICDLLIGYGQTDFSDDNAVDYQRSELFCKVEPNQFGRWTGPKGQHTLMMQWGRGNSISRMYGCLTGGLLFTINAEQVPSTDKGNSTPMWKADNYSRDSIAYSFGATYGNMGAHFANMIKVMAYQGGTVSSPWQFSAWPIMTL